MTARPIAPPERPAARAITSTSRPPSPVHRRTGRAPAGARAGRPRPDGARGRRDGPAGTLRVSEHRDTGQTRGRGRGSFRFTCVSARPVGIRSREERGCSMGVYEELGVKRLINAWGPMTIVGGSRMRPEVVAAMAEAERGVRRPPRPADARSGPRIAELIGVEGAYVAGGCAAGLAIATAACVAGTDRATRPQLPDMTGLKNEVVIARCHRNTYDAAFRQVGVKLVEIGNARGFQDWELEARDRTEHGRGRLRLRALDLRPAALAGRDGPHRPRARRARDRRRRGRGAAVPEPARPQRDRRRPGRDQRRQGLMGPQNTGLVLGRPDLIAGLRRQRAARTTRSAAR